jgi:hypothetical protein
MPVSISGTNGVTFPDSSLQAAAASPYVLKNRIINGDMRIDQRNAGASVTPTASTYTLDRWRLGASVASKVSVQQSSTAPIGFNYSTVITTVSAYTMGASEEINFAQRIEGYNTADLGWGTADAKTVTLSFWVRSSLTGTFGGVIKNSATTRSYPFSYTISVANTWEQKSVTIAGDTSGTWETTSSASFYVQFGIGTGSALSGTAGSWASSSLSNVTGAVSVVGTASATWYITGVQLEVGTTATPFERRMYGQELVLCQRYYETCFPAGTAPANGTHTGVYSDGVLGWCPFNSSTARAPAIRFAVTKRANPTVTLYNASNIGTSGSWGIFNGSSWVAVTTTVINAQTDAAEIGASSLSVTANYVYLINGLWAASAEL